MPKITKYDPVVSSAAGDTFVFVRDGVTYKVPLSVLQSYIILGLSDGLTYIGALDCALSPNYPAAESGYYYKCSVAGLVGGVGGLTVQIGDLMVCHVDASPEGTQAAVGANWDIFQGNITIDTDETLAADSDAVVPSQKAIKAYTDALGVPSATAENDFIIAGSSPSTWLRKTLAQMLAIIMPSPGTIGGTTPGIVNNVETPITHSATEAANAADMYGRVHKITGAYVVTLPAAVVGMSGVFRASTAAEFSVKAGGSDHFEMFDGTVISDADKITSSSGKNEFVQILCESANTWIVLAQNGAFTDSGA